MEKILHSFFDKTLYGILKEICKEVPAVKYASGILGIAIVVSFIIKLIHDPKTAVSGIVLILALMFILKILSSIIEKDISVQGKVIAWAMSIIFIIAIIFFVSSFFFGWPNIFPVETKGIYLKFHVLTEDKQSSLGITINIDEYALSESVNPHGKITFYLKNAKLGDLVSYHLWDKKKKYDSYPDIIEIDSLYKHITIPVKKHSIGK